MKKLLVTVTAALVCVGAFAQGKVQFANDSLHLVYYSTAGNLRAGDAYLAGSGPTASNMPNGMTLVADLYAGTTPSNLILVATTTFSGVSTGRFNNANITLPSPIAGGQTDWFQVQIRDNSYSNAAASEAGGSYFAFGDVFSTVPNTGVAFNSIVNHGNPSFSSWANGSYDMTAQTGLNGARGTLSVGVVPEPTSFALAGLGAAALLIFRRRK